MLNDIFVSVHDILKHIERSTLATLSLDDCETARLSYEKTLCNGTAKPTRQRRARKLTLAKALKQASKAGVNIVRYEVEPDGKVVIVTGKPEPKNETDRELEEFNARHG
jgi:hypothetical protein